MDYPEILALLDEEIARLEKARELLAHQPAPTRVTLKRKPLVERSAPEITTLIASLVPEIQHLRPRMPRKLERRPRTPAVSPLNAGALRGTIPAGPVAISADAARHAQVQRREAEAVLIAKKADAPQTLSAEMLLQRWLQPKNPGQMGQVS